jgi:hypothetical protein
MKGICIFAYVKLNIRNYEKQDFSNDHANGIFIFIC